MTPGEAGARHRGDGANRRKAMHRTAGFVVRAGGANSHEAKRAEKTAKKRFWRRSAPVGYAAEYLTCGISHRNNNWAKLSIQQ